MVEQQSLDFDPRVHAQAPPVVPIRDGLQRPAPPNPSQQLLDSADRAAKLFGSKPQDVHPAYIATARAIGQIIATRLLMLIAVITSSIIWCYAVWNPSDARTIAATAFAMVTMWPLTLLYWKKG